MKLLVLISIFAVLFFQMASGFVMAPSSFGGSSVVSLKQAKFYDNLCYNRRLLEVRGVSGEARLCRFVFDSSQGTLRIVH